MGTIIGLTAGLYQALNLLGAGGGHPNSFQTVQVVNATLCAVFAVSSAFGGSVLNTIGPVITTILGIIGYALYVAGLWYFDKTANDWFPILGGVAIGVSTVSQAYDTVETPLTGSKALCRSHIRRYGIDRHVVLRGRRPRIFYRHLNQPASGWLCGWRFHCSAHKP